MDFSLSEIKGYGNIEFLAKQLVEGFVTGLHQSPYHGFSVEFAEHRLYNTGESTRHIDWKVFARTDRLYIKKYEEETNLRCMMLLDTSSSMYYPEDNYGKLTFSTMAAAALAYMFKNQRDAVGVTTFSDQILQQTPVKSTSSHIHSLFMMLQQLLQQPPGHHKTAAAEAIHRIADKVQKRSLIIIFSDMFDNTAHDDELFAALQHLKHNMHEVLLFHVYDQSTELDFAFKEKPYEFIDRETGEKVKLHPNEVKNFYQKTVGDFYENLKMKCGQYKIDLVEADINKGFDQILMPYLVKRARMRS